MRKEETKNKFLTILTNTYVKNIIFMLIITVVCVVLALFGLNIYTKHNHSINVPDLKGMQVQDADALVSTTQLRYEVVDSIYQKNGIPGSILEQIPVGGSKVKEGRTIYLTVQSFSEPLVAIPDLSDISLRQAQTILNNLGFMSINVQYIASEYKDLVYSVEYKGVKIKPGQKIPKGSKISINVGNGGASVATPTDSIDNTETIIEEGI